MRQSRRELDLAKESLGADRLRDVGTQHLDRDLTPVTQVVRAMDRGQSACPDLGVECVAVAERAYHANEVIEVAGVPVGRDGRRRICTVESCAPAAQVAEAANRVHLPQ